MERNCGQLLERMMQNFPAERWLVIEDNLSRTTAGM
jgi:hypothetical protein